MPPEHAQRLDALARGVGERAWRLAQSLLHDAHLAYDAVQQAFLVAARKPEAVPAADPWPWFSTVLVGEVRNLRRKRRPRTNHAGALEGPDVERGPEQRPIEREEGERLRDALRALPPEEREAVVLTYLSGLTGPQAAATLGVPRQTLASRAERGLGALAARLGREPGPAARALALLPVAPPPGGLPQALEAWTQTALAGSAASTGASATTWAASAALVGVTGAGGLGVMTTKTIWLGAVALALGAGFAGGGLTQGLGLFAHEPAPAPAAATLAAAPSTGPGAGEPHAADGAGPALEGSPAALAQRLAEERAKSQRLELAVQDLTQRLLAAEQARPAAGSGPVFTFGAGGRLDAVRQADWGALAEAAGVVDDAVVEIHEHQLAGRPVPKATLLRLQEHTERMRTYEYRTLDKLPTAAQHNGELTHPISVANLVAGLLARAGKPLSAAQVAEIDRLGTAFEEDFARLREGWTERVPRVRRMLEEYRRKGRFTEDLFAVLTPEQRPLVVDPRYRGVAGLDLYDPTLMILHTSPLVAGADTAEIRAALGRGAAKAWGLPVEAQTGPVARLLDAFVARVAPGLEVVPKASAQRYTYAQGLAAGEATAELVEGLLAEGALPAAAGASSADVARALRESPTWFVPRLLAP